MVVIVTSKDFTTQLNNSLDRQSSCRGDILPVCFQKYLQFNFIYLLLLLLVFFARHGEANGGTDQSHFSKKLNQHFPLMAGRVEEEQREESKRHIYNKCKCPSSMSTHDGCF